MNGIASMQASLSPVEETNTKSPQVQNCVIGSMLRVKKQVSGERLSGPVQPQLCLRNRNERHRESNQNQFGMKGTVARGLKLESVVRGSNLNFTY
jgi:hypothetical protein